MFLAIDVGNTNTVLGYFHNGVLQKKWRIGTHPIPTSDEFRAKLQTLFSLDKIYFDELKDVVVSSVVPSFTSVIRSAFLDSSINLLIIDHTWPFSFELNVDSPHQVGTDRLVNAEAAVRLYGSPCIVVDSGTATTVCAISNEKQYCGGAIMPGIELSIEVLAKKAAQLFTVELMAPSSVIGKNTQAALRSGILFGYTEMIDGMVRRFKKEMGDTDIPVIATGGISVLLKDLLCEKNHLEPDLTLKGIAYLYERIRNQ